MDDQEVGADGHDLAQLNLSWARAPLHSRVMAGFVARTTAVDEDLAALEAFVQGPAHRAVMRLGSRWFLPPGPTAQVLWWVPAGHHPTLQEARDRRDLLDRHGPTDVAFTALTARQPPA